MNDHKKRIYCPIGLRTLKTAAAVTIALIIVEQYGASAAKLLFAMMGAIAAVGPTFKASLQGCAGQLFSVVMGACVSISVTMLPIANAAAVGAGVILIMAVYQVLHLKLSPVLPCLILVTICSDPQIAAVPYSLARLWDTAIGLGVGMLINMLVFPYDNSRKIRRVMEGLDKDLICFLEDMFDGDEHLPDTKGMSRKINHLQRELALFEDQRLLRRRRQKQELQQLKNCEDMARELMTELEALRSMDRPGRLNRANRLALGAAQADIPLQERGNRFAVEDLVANYHVARIMDLRQALKKELSENSEEKTGEADKEHGQDRDG